MLKKIYMGLRLNQIRLRYHALKLARSPVVHNAVGAGLVVDPADSRAWLLRRRRGLIDAEAMRLWSHVVSSHRPTVVIDIGANYGEVGLGVLYPPGTTVHLIEASPAVAACLQRTIASLGPKWPAVQLHPFAADRTTGTVELFLHGSSGMASVVMPSLRCVTVDARRLDEVVPVTPGDRVAFKLDVEGHERAVLEGMTAILATASSVGVCEIEHADKPTVDTIYRLFDVAVLGDDGVERAISKETLLKMVAAQRATGSWHTRSAILRSLSS